MTTNFFLTPLFCCCFWIRDPGSGIGKNQDPGSTLTAIIYWFSYEFYVTNS
jgi:hypothetical protein